MEVKIFGKPNCEFCKTTMKKFETFFGRWSIDKNQIPLTFYDMETVDGLAEGAFYGVTKIPSTVIQEGEDVLQKWHGKVPLSNEFKDFFSEHVKPESQLEVN